MHSTTTVLSIDTSTQLLSLSLCHQGIIYQSCHQTEKHANSITKTIQSLCQQAQTSLPSIGVITVNIGPGSFTGLRVGLASAQALAHALNIPIFPVKSSMLIAYSAMSLHTDRTAHPDYCVLTDARLSQVYFSTYQANDKNFPVKSYADAVLDPQSLPDVNTIDHALRCGPGWHSYQEAISPSWLQTQFIPTHFEQEPEVSARYTIDKLLTSHHSLSRATVLIALTLDAANSGQDKFIHAKDLKPHYVRNQVAKKSTKKNA